MITLYDHLRTVLTLVYNQMVGERNMRLISVDSNPQEVYRLQTTYDGLVVLYCTETLYELSYARWWLPAQRHYSYRVYGMCNGSIPDELATRMAAGLTLGRLLPGFAPRRFQKKAAIHAYVSLIVSELKTLSTGRR